MDISVIKSKSLNQQAYERIKRAIVQNELLPGTRIVDSQLAEMFGISRTPVRDAMLRLRREGLIENKGSKGYYVFDASERDVNEIYDIRIMIDKEVITRIINDLLANNYDDYMAEIDKVISYVEQSSKKTGVDFIKVDEAFHDSLVMLINNSRLIKLYQDIRNQTRVFRQITSYNEQRVKRALDAHRRMLLAIKEMNLDLALKIATEHVELSRKDALEDIKALRISKEDDVC